MYLVEHVRHYLAGHKFLVPIYHEALKWLFSFREPEKQLTRWIVERLEFTFDIKHIPDRLHTTADRLSRLSNIKFNISNKDIQPFIKCHNVRYSSNGWLCKGGTSCFISEC